MKKLLTILCVILLLITGAYSVSAENDDIKLTLNKNPIFFDVPPQIINNRTMVPLRAVFEAMGAMVLWENDGRIDVELNGKGIFCRIGENTMWVNYKEILVDSPPCIVNGRTLVPVRAISEALGADVKWNESTKTVEITYHPIYPLPIDGEQLSVIFGNWYSINCFEKDTLANKRFAMDFITMWNNYDESEPVFIRGGEWESDVVWEVLGDRDKLNSEYKLLFGCDMPYFTDEDWIEDGGIIIYNGQLAVRAYRYQFGEPGEYIYNHAEEKTDGSYDISFLFLTDYDYDYSHTLDEGRIEDCEYIFNISLVDNENGFIINSCRYYENGVLQPINYNYTTEYTDVSSHWMKK